MAFVVAATALALVPSPEAHSRDGLLRDRAVAGQGASDLVRRGVEQKLRCAEDCLVSGHLVLSSDDGAQLRANGLRPRPPVRIARLRNLRLEGGRHPRRAPGRGRAAVDGPQPRRLARVATLRALQLGARAAAEP